VSISTRDSNLSKIKSFYEAMHAGNMAVVPDLLDDTFVAHEPASLPYGGSYKGLDGFFQMLAGLKQHWRSMRFETERYSADDDLVYVHFRFTAKGRVSGKPIDQRLIELWRMKDGKAVEQHVFFADSKAAVDALDGTSGAGAVSTA
jgi:ketosteroid isomerase-like protein